MRVRTLFLLVPAALALWLLLEKPWAGRAAPLVRGPDAASHGGDAERDAATLAGAAAPAARRTARVATEGAAQDGVASNASGAGEAEGVAPPVAGRLRLAVLSGTTGEPTSDFVLRTLGDELVTTVQGAAPLEIEHAPGRYEGLVVSTGCDPLPLAPFEVRPAQATDLGTLRLRPGTASLEGTVLLDPGAAPEALAVALHGQGRNPCPACPERGGMRGEARAAEQEAPCAQCGHAPSASRATVEPGGTFRFDALAAGPYDVVVREAGGRVVALVRVELAPAEARRITIRIEFRDLELETVDADGRPFDGIWAEETGLYSADLRFHVWIDGVLAVAADIAPLEEVAGPLADPAATAPTVVREPALPASEAEADGGARKSADEVRERPGPPPVSVALRRPHHTLWPSAITERPELRSRASRVERRAPGRDVLRRVPLAADEVQLTCGPWFSGRVAARTADGSGAPVRVAILVRCGVTSEMIRAIESVSCTSCHALPRSLYD